MTISTVYILLLLLASVLVVFSTALCAAGQPASPLPRVSWEVTEINVTEGCIEIMCFTSDSGSADPYQVNVNARGKGSNPATSGKIIQYYYNTYFLSVQLKPTVVPWNPSISTPLK